MNSVTNRSEESSPFASVTITPIYNISLQHIR